jgi:hypothetical protein
MGGHTFVPGLVGRISLILVSILLVIFGAFLLEYYLTTNPDRPFGHTQGAHYVGWLGLGVIALTFVYPFKRWRHPNQVWPKRWFQVHLVCGLVGPAVIFVHAGLHFHALVPILALIAMGLVVLSGITGQAVHYMLFRSLYHQRHDLAYQGMPEEMIESYLHDLVVQEEVFRWWKCLHGPFSVTFVVLMLLHIGGAMYFGGL